MKLFHMEGGILTTSMLAELRIFLLSISANVDFPELMGPFKMIIIEYLIIPPSHKEYIACSCVKYIRYSIIIILWNGLIHLVWDGCIFYAGRKQ